MASKRAVAFVLAMLKEAFPTREVTERTPEVWLTIFEDVPDKMLTAAAINVARDPERTFFPTTGEVFAAIEKLRPQLEAPDTDGILFQIAKLGDYNPNVGWIDAKVGLVREKLGNAIAAAYGAAGATACFSDSQVTRDIARRRFAEELAVQQKTQGSPILASPHTPLLTEGATK